MKGLVYDPEEVGLGRSRGENGTDLGNRKIRKRERRKISTQGYWEVLSVQTVEGGGGGGQANWSGNGCGPDKQPRSVTTPAPPTCG